jgi:hypothetical protein
MGFGGLLRQSTAVDVLIGPFVDSTDGDTEEAALTINRADVLLSKNGQGAVQKTDVTAAASDADGFYNCELDATDTDTVGQLVLYVHVAGALAVRHDFQIVEEEPYDDIFAASAVGYLKPTTAGRDLDVTAAGEAGIDLDNTSGTIAAAQIATDAITAAKIAADAGVEIAQAVWDRVLTGATHNIASSAGRRLRGIQEFQGYANGAIWIDTVDGTAGTTDFENGTVENPVDSIADANTLAASLNIERFELAPGSSITLGAAQNNQSFNGRNWTLVLNGKDIAGSVFIGASVSGVASGTGTIQIFDKCILNAVSHIKDTHLMECGIAGTQTIAEAGDYFTDRCHSAIAGTATPAWDFGGALNSSNLGFRNYSGGIEIQNMGAGTGSYTMSLEGRGQLVINANCSATSTVTIRGLFTVTDNASGAVTLSDVARFAEDQNVTDVTGNVDGSVATIGTGGVIDGAIAAAELLNIADACLDRRLDLGTDTGGDTTTSRTWRDALRVLRNRADISGGTLTVYEEDDTTAAFTAAISTAAGDPIAQVNPT